MRSRLKSSGLSVTSIPRSYTFNGSVVLSSSKMRLFREPVRIIRRTLIGESQLTWKFAMSRSL